MQRRIKEAVQPFSMDTVVALLRYIFDKGPQTEKELVDAKEQLVTSNSRSIRQARKQCMQLMLAEEVKKRSEHVTKLTELGKLFVKSTIEEKQMILQYCMVRYDQGFRQVVCKNCLQCPEEGFPIKNWEEMAEMMADEHSDKVDIDKLYVRPLIWNGFLKENKRKKVLDKHMCLEAWKYYFNKAGWEEFVKDITRNFRNLSGKKEKIDAQVPFKILSESVTNKYHHCWFIFENLFAILHEADKGKSISFSPGNSAVHGKGFKGDDKAVFVKIGKLKSGIRS